ncbi:MAG TPA: GAF domain-containing protein [Sphingomicrobium sp.]|nr:GAF domain-containing protein [Sphingomicrobium sp.]
MLNQLAIDGGERDRLRGMFALAPGFMAILEGSDHRFTVANQAFEELVNRGDLVGKSLAGAVPELAEQGFVRLLDEAKRSGAPFVGQAMSFQVDLPGGWCEQIFVDLMLQPLSDAGGGVPGVFVQGHNVSEDKKSEELRTAHTKVLELAIGDSPLEQTLGELIKIVESTSRTEVLGSILLLDLDGKHLRHGAAPSLPREYMDAIDGEEIGPCAGSCGTAAYRAQPVFVSDIANDPLWAVYKAVALPLGLRACWSIPILTRGRRVLGTFAMYHREPREPTVRDLALVDLITQTAALVIDRERAHTALREIAEMADED